jgi:hypothetical protein
MVDAIKEEPTSKPASIQDAEFVNMAIYKLILPEGMDLGGVEMLDLSAQFNEFFIAVSKKYPGMRLIFNAAHTMAGGAVIDLVPYDG